ncbi:MAG: hypothetical protein AAF799_43835 [Myxococcota bacterium]
MSKGWAWGVVLLTGCTADNPRFIADSDAMASSGGETGAKTADGDGEGEGSTGRPMGTDEGTGGDTTLPPSDEGTDDGQETGGLPSCFDDIGERCDPYTVDACPPGQKCSPHASFGEDDGARCVPIAAENQFGDPCEFFCEGTQDTCGFGLMCLTDEPGSNVCISMCVGDNPCNPAPLTCVDFSLPEADFGLCLIGCDPLNAETCPQDALCIPFENTFACIDDDTGEDGVFGDPCQGPGQCDPGLTCIPAEFFPECPGAIGCCSYYCNLDTDVCANEFQCVPYEEPILPNVGVCAVPPG